MAMKESNENKKKFQYLLVTEIRSAKNLEDKKLLGEHAVYVAVDANGQTKHTKTIKDINNPKWNETLVFELNEIPEFVQFRVRDERMILPNLNLGHYRIDIKNKLLSVDALVPTILVNGEVQLIDSAEGKFDISVVFQDANLTYISPFSNCTSSDVLVSGPYEEVKKKEFQIIPPEVFEKVEVKDINSINDNKVSVSSEHHVLPTIHLQEAPKIIQKEVQYIKPVEVHQTIIEKEIPKIIERPVIIEKHEHYVQPSEVVREETKIIKEVNNNPQSITQTQDAIENLKRERQEAFNNTKPIIEHQAEEIVLDTDIRERPVKVNTKEVIYEQPIQIERKQVEEIKPVIVEDVAIDEKHIYEQTQPTIVTETPVSSNPDNKYYSQEVSQ